MPEGGLGVGGAGTPQSFTQGGSALRSTPLPLYILFLTEKVSLSYTFNWLINLSSAPFQYLARLEHYIPFNCFK